MTSEPLTSSHAKPPEPDTKRGRWWAWWLRPKVAIPLFLIALFLLAPTLIRGYRLSLVPDAPEPFDTQAVIDFVVPDEQNAFVEFRQAADLLVALSKADQPHLEKALEGEWEDVPEPIRQWIDGNRRVIELWERGAGKPDAQYIRASDISIHTLLPVLEQLRTMAQLAKLDAMRLRAAGHPDQAWDLLRSGLQVGQHTGRRGILIERLVGLALSKTISEGIVKWAHDPRVTTELLRRASTELDNFRSQQPLVSTTLQREYLLARGALRSPYLIEEMLSYKHSSLPSAPGLGGVSLYTLGEPSLSDRALNHAFRNYLTEADKPARERAKQLNPGGCFELDPRIHPTAPTASQVNTWIMQATGCRLVIPVVSQAISALNRDDLRISLLKTVLALEIYRRQHSNYPENLSAMIPDFMPEVPDDIFELVPTPLKYRREGANALLWSVGSDGTDNAGNFERDKDVGYFLGPALSKTHTQDGDSGTSK